jgi:hypothetical protein
MSWCVYWDQMRRRVAMCVVFLCLMQAPAPLLSRAQSDHVFEFDIPAQPLDHALKSFAATTDFLLSYEAAMTAGLVSTGVTGRYTSVDALRRLLTDTGLNYRFANDTTITLQPVSSPVPTPVAPPQSQTVPHRNARAAVRRQRKRGQPEAGQSAGDPRERRAPARRHDLLRGRRDEYGRRKLIPRSSRPRRPSTSSHAPR